MPGFLRICHTLKRNESVHIQCGLPSLLPFPARCLKLLCLQDQAGDGSQCCGPAGQASGLAGELDSTQGLAAQLPGSGQCPAVLSGVCV